MKGGDKINRYCSGRLKKSMCVDQIGRFSHSSATQLKRTLMSKRWAVLCSYSGRVAGADCVGGPLTETTLCERWCEKDKLFS